MMAWRRFAGSGDAVEAAPLSAPFPPLPPVPPPPPAEEEGEEEGEGEDTAAPPVAGAATAGSAIAGSGPAAQEPAVAGATLRLVKVVVNRRRGTARLLVEVSGPGRLALKGAVPRDRAVSAAGTVALGIVPRSAQRQLLAREGRLPLKVTVSFQPLGGDPLSRRLTVRLKTGA
jgi:hypothetical protein